MKLRWSFICILGIVVIGAALRLWAATDNFWLDEVATYYLALQLGSPMEALTRVRLDHHILNTAYMNAVGDQYYWGVYRILSFITGIAAVLLMTRESAHRGRRQLFISTLMAALSYPLIVYSSEARGYAPAICFSLAAFICLQAGWQKRILILRFFFGVFAILALLSHATAIYPILGMSAWSLYRLFRTFRDRRHYLGKEIIDCAVTYLPVYAAFLGMYMIMKQSGTTGGDIDSLPLVIMQTLAYLLGFPASGKWLFAAALASIFLISAALVHTFKSDRGRFFFYITTIILAPSATLLFNPRDYIYPRYFILAFPFVFLLLSEWLDSLWQRQRIGNAAAVGLLALFIIGNGIHISRFLSVGRGGYFKAMQTICNHSPGNTVAISGDHNFRVGMMVNYYRRYFEPEKFAYYLPSYEIPASGVDWYITHQTTNTTNQPGRITVGQWIYQKIAVYPFYGLSGMQWTLYARERPVDD